ncbi:TatD family hydrolase [Pantoea sp. Mhis]|uniref:TatD family hydrolase n=1 Tax=Pantoea sp. Mhis TaxID=2576759 RepID=UPI0013593E4F|nr:TatD family hydrolase [Pantoea sp. Mhis]MXP56696.1 metal-dependent hydrolase [Pantoea sp. Mhis]
MRFIDTHCHLNDLIFTKNINISIFRAKKVGIKHIIIPSVNASDFSDIDKLCKQYNMLYAALGLHPIDITNHRNEDLDLLDGYLQIKNKKLIAIGEIGLDLSIDKIHFDKQIYLLNAQLKLAKKYDLPVILHSHHTHDQLSVQLRRHNLPCRGIIHGFTGSQQQANNFINLGYMIGIGGVITYKRANKTRNTISNLPLDSMILETDSPGMPLNGFQEQPNRPERILDIFKELCLLRTESPQYLADVLWQNTIKIYNI